MRYAIGFECQNKDDNNNSIIGLYALNFAYLPFFLKNPDMFLDWQNKYHPIYTPVFDDMETAITFAQSCCRQTREEARKNNVIYNFFPIKVDSSNFKYHLAKKSDATKKIKRDRFNVSLKNPVGNYKVFRILSVK